MSDNGADVDTAAAPLTEDELVEDLSRLLREGLVTVDEALDEDVPRFRVTKRGQAWRAVDEPTEGGKLHFGHALSVGGLHGHDA